MKTTRRGLFAWLGALTGAAAVSRVVPAEAEARPVFTHVATNPEWTPPSKRFAHHFTPSVDKLRTPEDVLEMLRQSPTSEAIRAAQTAIDAEAEALYSKPVRLSREQGVTEPHDVKAFTLTTMYKGSMYGSLDERCPGHRRGCDLGMGHAPYNKCSGYEPGSGGWTIGDLKNEAT